MNISSSARLLAGMMFALLCAAGRSEAGPIADPIGDTFNAGTHDITSTHALSYYNVTTRFTVTFVGPISAPSAFAANSVLGRIDIDTDENPATGGTAPWGGPVTGGNAWINFFQPPNPGVPPIPGPLVAIGDEFFVDIDSEMGHPGSVDVIRTSDNAIVGTVPIAFAANSLTIDVSLGLLGADEGYFRYAVLVGDFAGSTDRAPNGAVALQSEVIPEPASLLLFAVGLAGTALGVRRRRRA